MKPAQLRIIYDAMSWQAKISKRKSFGRVCKAYDWQVVVTFCHSSGDFTQAQRSVRQVSSLNHWVSWFDSVRLLWFTLVHCNLEKENGVNVSIMIIGSTYMKTACFSLFILAFYVEIVRGSLCSGSESADDYYHHHTGALFSGDHRKYCRILLDTHVYNL